MALPSVSAFGFSGTDWGAAAIERQWARADQQRAQDFSMEMSNTAWQRGVADMEAAGLNPMLAFSQGPASSPGGVLARGPTFPRAGGEVSYQTAAQTDVLESQAERTRAETMSNEKLAERLEAEIDYIRTQRSTSSSQMNVNQQHAAVLREESRIKLQEAKSAEEFLVHRNAAELAIILAEAKGMKLEGEIDETKYGEALRYIQRAVRAAGSAVGGVVGGVVGGTLSRGLGVRRGGGTGVRPPRQTSPDYFRGLRRD